MTTNEPLPPRLECVGQQLTAAAAKLYGSHPPRRRWWQLRRGHVLTLAVAGVLASAGIAAAAIVPTLTKTGRHQLYTPTTKGALKPIDTCWKSPGDRLYVCASFVGTTVEARNVAGKYIAPSDCSWHEQVETCRRPFRFTLDLTRPGHPRLVAQKSAK